MRKFLPDFLACDRRLSYGGVNGTGAGKVRRSFPYGILMIPLWFVLTIMGAAPFSFLVFFTIPLYRWVANIMDAAEQRERLHGEDEGRR